MNAKIPDVDLSGLQRFSLSELGKIETNDGQPLDIPLDEIEEDPRNARTEYDEAELEQLSQSIQADKVREPISVRPKNALGKYIINSGSRRYRASIRAGKASIPAFIDGDADEFARFVVNEQREALSPMDIANFINRHASMTQAEIAARIGKSREYVAQHAALLKLPPAVLALYNNKICRNATALAELGRLYKRAPELVERGIADVPEITGQLLRTLRETVAVQNDAQHNEENLGNGAEAEPSETMETNKTKSESVSMQIKVKYAGKTYRLDGEFKTLRKPQRANNVWIVKGRDEPVEVAIDALEFESVICKE